MIKETVKPCNEGENGGKTYVHVVFYAFEMNFKFLFGSIDPTIGTLANSHKAKFDNMKSWVDSLLHE